MSIENINLYHSFGHTVLSAEKEHYLATLGTNLSFESFLSF